MSDATTALPDGSTEALAPYLRPDLFRAMGDPTRLTLLARLATSPGASTVTNLSSCCGVHLSGVSRHLKILLDAGLVKAERQGREMLYRLDCASLSGVLRGLADALEQCQAKCSQAKCCQAKCCQPGRSQQPGDGKNVTDSDDE